MRRTWAASTVSRGAAEPRRKNSCEMRKMRALDDITEAIIHAAIQIHRDLGPGLLESVYEAVLARALEKRGSASLRVAAPPREPSGADSGRTALSRALLGQPSPGIQPRPATESATASVAG